MIRSGTMHQLSSYLLLSAAMVFSPVTWATDQAALDLLVAMSQAGDSLEYSGEFVHVSEGRISSMKIMHMPATAERGSQQKLMALDGSMREIIQQDDMVACVLPDQKMGVREKRQARKLFKLNLGPSLDRINDHYLLDQQGLDRVANRDCTQLNIVPKDEYRYGYALCIDLDTHLLLSSELLTADGAVLESYRFVSIQFESVDMADISSLTPASTLKWMDDSKSSADKQASSPSTRWEIRDNPSGFVQTHYIERISPLTGTNITHLVLSDGLARVSVFISPKALSASESGTLVNLGGINSFSRLADDHMITAVGEVPAITVHLLTEQTSSKQE